MQQKYKNELNHLPKGTLVPKKIGSYEYYYLKYRDGKKTVTDYVGRDSKRIEEVKDQLKKREHFERMLAELKKENELIQKLIGGSQ